jgi:hemerythrin-like domain-containing protein
MRAIELLRNEQTLIERVVSCLGRAADAVREGGPVDKELFLKALEFVNGFAHRVHQAREDILLRHMEEHGLLVPETTAHGDTREFADAMVRALPEAARGDDAARRMLSENAKAYVGLVRSHMQRAETDVFAAAEAGLSNEDDQAMLSLFRAAERAATHDSGEAAAERYERLADEIGQRHERAEGVCK